MRQSVHILFLDIVRYSTLSEERQGEAQRMLRDLVDRAPAVAAAKSAGTLRELPRGDGMALLFETAIGQTLETALFLDEALRLSRAFTLRMGIHTGIVAPSDPASPDSERIGEGIDTARRVLDSADPEHILLSETAAAPLQSDPTWGRFLHPLGVGEVKHGVRLRLVSFHGTRPTGVPFGNEVTPRLVFQTRQQMSERQQRDEEQARATRIEGRRATIVRAIVYTPLALIALFATILVLPVMWENRERPWHQAVEAVWQRLDQVRGATLPPASPPPPVPTAAPTSRRSLAPEILAGPPTAREVRPRSEPLRRSATLPIPDLRGLQPEEARRDTSEFHLTVREEFHDTTEGEIYEQDPRMGYARRGATITVFVSRGPKPAEEPTPEPDSANE